MSAVTPVLIRNEASPLAQSSRRPPHRRTSATTRYPGRSWVPVAGRVMSPTTWGQRRRREGGGCPLPAQRSASSQTARGRRRERR